MAVQRLLYKKMSDLYLKQLLQWEIIHYEYRTHQLSRKKDKGLKDIPRVAEDEICNRREIMQAAYK
jgi:hypothetical protein